MRQVSVRNANPNIKGAAAADEITAHFQRFASAATAAIGWFEILICRDNFSSTLLCFFEN